MSLQCKLFILACIASLYRIECADKYTDENRPYEFGFKIDGEQHRQEKKDENGIIMGEFGFITADGVYHVTVYATDENGGFKILSMKNIRVKPYPTTAKANVKKGHSLPFLPSQQLTQSPNKNTALKQQLQSKPTYPNAAPQTPSTTLQQPHVPGPASPAKSCSHCSLPTTTKIPELQDFAVVSRNDQLPETSAIENPTHPQEIQTSTDLLRNREQNYYNLQENSEEQLNYPQKLASKDILQKYPQQLTNFANLEKDLNVRTIISNEKLGPQQRLNSGQSSVSRENQFDTLQQGNIPYQISPQIELNLGYLEEKSPSGVSRNPKYYNQLPQQQDILQQQNEKLKNEREQQNTNQRELQQEGPQQQVVQYKGPKQQNPQQQEFQQENPKKLEPQQYKLQQEKPQQVLPHQTPPEIQQSVNNNPQQGYNPVQTHNLRKYQDSAQIPTKPTLISAQMQIVDANTDIYYKGPGEKEGLPDGLTKDDMTHLLYTFNYTVGFHGHFEEGYTNSAKQGYYYVTNRNGVRTRIDYIADEKGFRPKITQEVLDLLSDDIPKPETEKDAKFGLKGYEFKWLYYPIDSKRP